VNEGAAAGESRGTAYVLLAVGVLSVGAAAILIRLAAAPPLVVSFWRTAIGGAALLVVVKAMGRPMPSGPHLARALVAGVLLGAHFWLWIASLDETSVAASVVLVCLQPVFVSILAFVFLRERTPLVASAGIVVALAGTALIALDGAAGAAGGNHPLLGDALALGGAVAIAVYVLVGRRSAGHTDVMGYSAAVSLAAAASLAVPLVVTQRVAPFPPTASSWLWVGALALGPQLVGHTALNAALARLPAPVVSGSILGEPIIATGLAWLFLDEKPGLQTLAGSAVVLAGLWLLLRRPRGRVDVSP
jgi:drug/metabolite transporter (DMT)-like permease